LSQAHAYLKNAKSELETVFRAAKAQSFGPPKNDAVNLLECAEDLLHLAHLIALEHVLPAKTTPPATAQSEKEPT
jgi:hypothetical protein